MQLNIDDHDNPIMDIVPRYQTTIDDKLLELTQGDITQEHTDAIVNAANSSLLGGGGVDGAIHRAAGPGLLAETRQLGGCETGDAKISGGYRLPAKHVIHTVGPVYQPNSPAVAQALASAYRRSLEVASDHHLTSIAFPAISTGVYGYPVDEAAEIALNTVIAYLASGKGTITQVRFVLFTEEAYDVFVETLKTIGSDPDESKPA